MTAAQVETKYGTLVGAEQDGVLSFKGIPYARPPVGKLRFQPPQPPLPWAGVREATAFGNASPQPTFGALGNIPGFTAPEPQDEDCLFLNVWTPAADDAARPVMFWIHGGAFFIGSSGMTWYDGAKLARRGDVVVVSINYRLGALGFLHLGGLADGFSGSGNAALLDQVAALEWVRDNIAAFGGDPGNVTIFGESAGGMSVGTLLGTPAAQGLFHKAIAQSGAAHNRLDATEATGIAQELMGHLGLGANDVEKLLELPVDSILEAQAALIEPRFRTVGTLPFQPVVDGDVLPRPAIDSIRAGMAKGMPLLAGTNKDEMNLFAFMDPEAGTLDDAALVARCELRLPDGKGGSAPAAYRESRAGTAMEVWSRINGDFVFRIPAVKLAEAQSAVQPDTYMYLFAWTSPLPGFGACHALEIPFVFGTLDDPMAAMFTGSGPEADALSEAMQDTWLTFARTGSPQHAGIPDWTPYDADRRSTMLIDREWKVEDDPMSAERAWWEGVL